MWSTCFGGIKEPLATLFTSAFLHANLPHLLSNVLFLWVFGPRVESSYGPRRFAIYYVLWGVAASIVQIGVTPDSGIPMVGASGAIAGVMGSYLLLYPAAVIETVILPFFWWILDFPAWLLLGFWFLIQIFLAQPGWRTGRTWGLPVRDARGDSGAAEAYRGRAIVRSLA